MITAALERAQRDADIHVAAEVAALFAEDSSRHFILTGSYAIEALTGGDIYHNDIDANIFTSEVSQALANTALMLCEVEHGGPQLTKQTDSRLEYLVETPIAARKLELQFVETTPVSHEVTADRFLITGSGETAARIPTTTAVLKDSLGRAFEFQVKSLPFAIATWALRISGAANAQKRPVRQTDIDHFAFLVAAAHDPADVLAAMNYHPQMPSNHAAEEVLARALVSCNTL